MATQERQLAGEIVRAALKRPVHERAAYLAASCAGNDALRQEVEVLLRYNQQPDQPTDAAPETQTGKAPSQSDESTRKKNSHPLTQVSERLRASGSLPSETPNLPATEVLDFFGPSLRANALPPNEPGPTEVVSMPEGTMPLEWLSRLTDDGKHDPLATTMGPSPFATTTTPAQTEILSEQPSNAGASRPDMTEVLVPPSTETPKPKTGGFEQLFQRITMPPAGNGASQKAKSENGASASLYVDEATSDLRDQAEFVPPAAPEPPPLEPRTTPPKQAASDFSAPFQMPSDLNASAAFTTGAKTLDGRMLGPYQLLYEIGRGGMGRVYLAEDTRLGRRVALKLLLRSSTRSPERVKRFEQEARAASSLNHPNILTIHEIGEIKGVHYLATEFVEGFTLRQVIEHKRLTLTKILDVAVQIADALATAHDANIVHRDIKPENLMMRLDGYVKVLDFGIAKLLENNTAGQRSNPLDSPVVESFDTQPGMIIGTSDYMSPEQARGLRVDKRTDIFSLGIVLYEMVTGVRPFTGATATDVVASLLTREPIPITQRLSGAPEALHRIIKRALAKDREDRYPSARELSQDLKALRQDIEIANRVVSKTGNIPGRAPQSLPGSGRVPFNPPTTNRMGEAQQRPSQQISPRPSRPSQKIPPRPSKPIASQPISDQPFALPSAAPPGTSPFAAPSTPPNVPPQPEARQAQEAPKAQASASARLGTRPKPATVDLPPPVPQTGKPIIVGGVVHVPKRSILKQKIGWGPVLLFALLLAGLGIGLWWNYFRSPSVNSIAILPFNATRLSGNSTVSNEEEDALRFALADGLHESLIQRLSPLPNMLVIARNSVRNLRKGVDMREAGKYLGVRSILTGRIVTRGSSITVSLELYDTTKGEMRWSQRFERTVTDMQSLPDAMSEYIASQLPLTLNAVQSARLTRRETNNAEAFQDFLKGRYLWQQRQPDTVKSSISYLRRAVELDPKYARAYAALAESYATAPLVNAMTLDEALPLCRTALSKAMNLDPQMAETYHVNGFVLHQYDWKFGAAEKSLLRAIELNPNLSSAYQEYSNILIAVGSFDEGLHMAEKALVLDPLATMSRMTVASAYYYAGRNQEAIDQSLNVIELNPKAAGAYKYQALSYVRLERFPDALDTLQKALAFAPADRELQAQMAASLALSGNPAEAKKMLEELRALPASEAVSQYRLATVYAALGDKEAALVALTQAVANREQGVVWIKVDPQLNTLREDQRFKELAKQIGLS